MGEELTLCYLGITALLVHQHWTALWKKKRGILSLFMLSKRKKKKKEKKDISIQCPLGKVTGSLLLWILYEFCIGVGTWNGLYLGDYSIHGDFLVKSYRQFPVQAWEFPLEKVQIILKTSMMYLFSLKNCVRRRGTCLSALDFSLRKAKESLFPKAHGCQCGSYFRFLSGFVYFKDQGF